MGCNCGGQAAQKSSNEYVVTTANGTKTFSEEPEARIFATMNNGQVTVRTKK